MSVEPRPAPRPNAAASGTEEARMSCPVRIVAAPVSFANAAPTASATPSSSWSGTTPLMSYALTMLARSPTAGHASRLRPGLGLYLASLSVLRGARAQHAEVAAAAAVGALADGLLAGVVDVSARVSARVFAEVFAEPALGMGLHDRVGQRFQVVGALLGRVHGQPHHIPAARRGQPAGVLLAQVIAVRLDVRGQRAEDRGRVAVHVGQRVYRRMLACGARAAPRLHPAHLAHITVRSSARNLGTTSDTW